MLEFPAELKPENLMEHMRVLCQDIVPRPSASAKERQAADYVERTVRRIGVTGVQRQPFKSHTSAGWPVILLFMLGVLASMAAILGGWWGKLIGSVLLLGSAYIDWMAFRVRPLFFQKWLAWGNSQNVIARIPATNQPKQTIYLVGHLDSQKQRFLFPSSHPRWMKADSSFPILFGVLGGGLLLAEFFAGSAGGSWWHYLLGTPYLYGLLAALYDEAQPYVEGANDNASAVSVLLACAQALKSRPLQNSEVVLLFTGCEEVGCVGLEKYLKAYKPARNSSFWIDLEIVGQGRLCYITRHGITYLTEYEPHPQMVELAERATRKQPDLGVVGKEMLSLDEIATLSQAGYKSICVSGYDDRGFWPNWHRLSDRLENIEPETLSRAACYTWGLMEEIDRWGE